MLSAVGGGGVVYMVLGGTVGQEGSGGAAKGSGLQGGGACRSGGRGMLLANKGAGAWCSWCLGALVGQKGYQHSSQHSSRSWACRSSL